MKSAVGNAFLLNIVITFILIFFSLLIGSMAYTKAYKVKNHILNSIDQYATTYSSLIDSSKKDKWSNIVNPYLGKVGYNLNQNSECPKYDNYEVISNIADYDYCLYYHKFDGMVRYKVVAYMKFDFPVIGEYLRLPISGETRDYISIE